MLQGGRWGGVDNRVEALSTSGEADGAARVGAHKGEQHHVGLGALRAVDGRDRDAAQARRRERRADAAYLRGAEGEHCRVMVRVRARARVGTCAV